MQKFFLGLLIVVLGIVGYESIDVIRFLTKVPAPLDAERVVVMIEPGPFPQVVQLLKQNSLITDEKKFAWWARVTRQANKVRVGEYAFRRNMTPQQVLSILTSGKSILHNIVIQEGMNAEDIKELLVEKGLVQGKKFWNLLKDKEFIKSLGIDADFLEGYLYPNTYSFTKFTGEKQIVRTMVDEFKHVWETEIDRAAKTQGLTQKQIITLASVIEKETGAPQERPLIASVFYNRLKLNMPLQSDPTVIYGKKGDKKNISKRDLKTDHPWNTYTRRGLPIGPICNPGKDAMIAAVEPATTNYLYFVSQNNGTHIFSETYTAHQHAVNKFQLNKHARESHSWRELSKKLGKAAKTPAGKKAERNSAAGLPDEPVEESDDQ